MFLSSFSTNISILHEAYSNIYVISFTQTLLCMRIVEYNNLYPHNSSFLLLVKMALTQSLFNETTGNLCGPV
jgi:hypothetical protein